MIFLRKVQHLFYQAVHLSSLMLICLISACRSEQKDIVDDYPNASETSYAKEFGFKSFSGYTRLWIRQEGDQVQYFYLIKDLNELPEEIKMNQNLIQIPISVLVAASTTQIPWLDELRSSEVLSGFPDPHYLYSEIQRTRFEKGELKDLGGPSGFELEQLVELKPDVVLSFPGRGEENLEKLLRRLKIPLIRTREHLEVHPLGRAEWIRFMGLLLDRQEKADSIFSVISTNYINLTKEKPQSPNQPAVLTGIPYSGVWYLPGQGSYAATLFKDAGFKYEWGVGDSKGTLPLSLEAVYGFGLKAEFWIGVSNFPRLQDLIDSDQRFTEFKSVKTLNIWTYDKQLLPSGGNGYFESAGLRPDWLLSDLIKIRKSSDTANLIYYRRLR